MNKNKIDLSQVPDHAWNGMARKVRSGLDGFYSDPENRKRFEEWKRKREAGEGHDKPVLE